MKQIVRRKPCADPLYPSRRIACCAFTGYRPQKMPFGFDETDERCLDFKQRLHDTIEMLIWQGYSHFISGGALGMDMFAAEAVIKFREQYPWIALEIAIPYENQDSAWEKTYQQRYHTILESADILTYVSYHYTKGALFSRNRYMVNSADLLLAAYDGQPGGTQMTCDYARKMGIDICYIRPVIHAG